MMQDAVKRAVGSFKYLWRELTCESRRIVPALELSAVWLWVSLSGCSATSAPVAAPNEGPASPPAELSSAAPVESPVSTVRRIHIGARAISLDGQAVDEERLSSLIQRHEEVVISADRDAPFAGVNRVIAVLLAGDMQAVGVTFGGATQAVELGKGYLGSSDDAAFLIMVVSAGVSVKGPGGNVAPGCEGIGAGVAIPRIGEAQDDAAAVACAKRIGAVLGPPQYHLVGGAKVSFGEVESLVSGLNSAEWHLVGLRVF